MAYRRTLTVFLGSPGDLPDERDAAQATVDEINQILANRAGFHLDLIRWEDSVPGYGNPQERLNQELARADLFIGMLNRKWGSPPAVDGPYSSGFEEEYRRSLARRKDSGAPEMMLLLKQIPEAFLADIGPDLRKVLDFRQELIDTKPVFFKDFESPLDLQQKLRSALAGWIHALTEAERTNARETVAEPVGDNALANESERPAFSGSAAAFLSGLAGSRRPDGRVEAAEVARLRLLGAQAYTSQNDVQTLGVHDTNLLYSDYPHADLSAEELEGLVQSGYDHFKSKNVPLWTWVRRRSPDLASSISLDTIVQPSASLRSGAIRALGFLSLPPGTAFIPRSDFINFWLDGAVDRDVRLAGLEYLAQLGAEADLPALWAALEDTAAGQVDDVVLAILGILARTDRMEAFHQLLELNAPSPSSALVDAIFAVADAVPDDWLIRALSHRSSRVRIAALKASTRLGAGRTLYLDGLAKDDDAGVRAEAVLALEDHAGRLDPLSARRVLVRSTRNALFIFGRAYTTGVPQWRAYRHRAISAWSRDQVSTALQAEREPDLLLALIGARGNVELLRAVVDQEGAIDLSAYWPTGEGIPALPTLSEDEVPALHAEAVRLLAARADPADLSRIRTTMAASGVEPPQEAYAYLAEFGDWSDVDRILNATGENRGRTPPSLLSIPDRSAEYSWAADSLVSLSNGRWEELLSAGAVAGVLRRLVLALPRRAWGALSDATLMRLLQAADDQVRERAATRSVRDLPAKRLRTLLAQYLRLSSSRYYNVIHWLDLGVALPRDAATAAARKHLDGL